MQDLEDVENTKLDLILEEYGDSTRTFYDADLYDVGREFDLTIDGLTVESSSDKLQKNSHKTNNIINSIMPFDIENAVKYNSNYLKGYNSEKRDVNVEILKPLVEVQSKDIARFSANESLKEYDRGVNWNEQDLQIKGEQWKTAYLPVWLYSYQQKKGDKDGLLHYVAVNARTKETMGSVPIHIPKLFGISALIELLCFLAYHFMADFQYRFLFLLIGIIYFFVNYGRYRNSGARHHHETETNKKMYNLSKEDHFIRHEIGLSNSRMQGANNTDVSGTNNILKNINKSMM